MTDDELVDHFGQACLRAGQASGPTINPMAEARWQAMQEWRQLMKDRMKELRDKMVDAPPAPKV